MRAITERRARQAANLPSDTPQLAENNATTAPIAALSIDETDDRSRINRVCFSHWDSAHPLGFPIACIPSHNARCRNRDCGSCRLRFSFLSELHGLAVVSLSARSKRNGFTGACLSNAQAWAGKCRAAERTLRLCRCGKSRGCLPTLLKFGMSLLQLGELQAVINHRLRAGHAQTAAGLFQLGQAAQPARRWPHCPCAGRQPYRRLRDTPRTDQFINLLFPQS